MIFNYTSFQVRKVLKVFELHFTFTKIIFIAKVMQTYSGTVRALPDASYTLAAAFAVSDVDTFPAAWADTVVQAECTQECAV